MDLTYHSAIDGVAGTAYPFPIALEVHHPKVNVPVLTAITAWQLSRG